MHTNIQDYIYINTYFTQISICKIYIHTHNSMCIYIYTGKTIHLRIASVHDSAPARPPTRWARLNQNRWMPRMAASWLATNGEVPHRTVVAWGKVGGGVYIYILYTCLEWYVLFWCLFFKSACFFLKGCFISGVSDETDVFWKRVHTRLYRYNVV